MPHLQTIFALFLTTSLMLIFDAKLAFSIRIKSDIACFDTVKEFIRQNVDAHYFPKTLRLVWGNSSQFEKLYPTWKILYQLAPILLFPLHFSSQVRNKFHTSTVAYFLLDKESTNSVVNHLQVETANRRWDRLVLVGMDQFIRERTVLKLLQGYRQKMGLSIDTNTIWVEPKLFDENNLLVSINSLNDYNSGSRMGSNIRRRHFRIAGCEFPPWTMKVRDSSNGKERVWGSHYEIIAFAAKTFNFTFETNVLDGPNYGELHPNGSWSGMYALIYYRELGYDFCFMLGHDASWSAYVDYASTFGTIDLIFVTAWPIRELKWTAIFEPLQQSVWFLTAVSYYIVSIFIYIFKKVQPLVMLNTKKAKPLGLVESFLTSYSVIVEQGIDNVDGIKFLLTLWLMFTIIIGTGYKSTLKSRLTFPSPEILPSDYKELAARSDFEIILNAQGVVEKMFFATTLVPEMVNIRNRMRKEFSTEECVKAAFLRHTFACIGWYPYFKQTASATLTLFSRLEPLIYRKASKAHFNSLSMAFQKDSIFVDAFTPLTAALFEMGVYFTWEEEVNNYFKEIGRKKVLQDQHSEVYEKLVALSKMGDNVQKPLTTGNVWLTLVILGLGWGIGSLVLVAEIVYRKPL